MKKITSLFWAVWMLARFAAEAKRQARTGHATSRYFNGGV